jgi:hypothetical protein
MQIMSRSLSFVPLVVSSLVTNRAKCDSSLSHDKKTTTSKELFIQKTSPNTVDMVSIDLSSFRAPSLGDKVISVLTPIITGAVSGGGFTFVSQVPNNLFLLNKSLGLAPSFSSYKQILSENSIQSLMKGWKPRTVQGAGSYAMIFGMINLFEKVAGLDDSNRTALTTITAKGASAIVENPFMRAPLLTKFAADAVDKKPDFSAMVSQLPKTTTLRALYLTGATTGSELGKLIGEKSDMSKFRSNVLGGILGTLLGGPFGAAQEGITMALNNNANPQAAVQAGIGSFKTALRDPAFLAREGCFFVPLLCKEDVQSVVAPIVRTVLINIQKFFSSKS